MKKLMMAVGVCVCAHGLFGGTLNVPSTGYPDIATAVAAAKSGDEIVIAKSATPYVLAAKLTLPTGVTVRGETGDFNDVVISGGGKLNGAFVVGINCAVSNITFTSFVMPGSSDAIISETGSGARYVDNCRFTANSGTSYGSILISNTQLSTYSRIVVDNCQLGHQCQSGLLCIQKGTFTDCVITNNYVQNDISGDQMPDFIHVNNNSTATLKNSFIGYNDYGTAHGVRIGQGEYCGAVKVSSGTLENCVIVGNEIRHASPQKVGAVWRNGGSIKNCIILENGLDADDWVKVGGSSYSYCLSTDTGTMKTSVDGDWGDIVAKPGELPWIPYGSRAIGAGEKGGDIGRIWTPATLKCAVKQDRRQYTGAATANLLALASEEATFAWTLVSGAATLTPDGKNATLAFDGPGTAVVRVTATSASETATDEIAVVSTPAVYEVATTAELEAAVDVAQDGAEIVLAANTYTPAKNLVLKNAVTVRGATGNRADVVVDGNSARRVFTIDHPGASIASLTVKRGNAEYAAGIMMEAGGLLTNVAVHTCKITGWKGYYNADAQWYFCGGGGVANFNGKVLDCDISNHQRASGNYWSGITAYGQHGPYALGDRLTITNNTSANTSTATSGNYRSVPVVLNGDGTIRNVFIAYNDVNILNLGTKVQDACGILVQDGTLENSTIFRNRVHANYFGYAAGLNLESKGSVVNCLITENGDANGNVDNYRIAAGAKFDHCATAPVPAEGTDCVGYAADPMTLYDIDAVGYPVPKPETPTVDAGADLDWTVEPTAVDLFGNLRKQGELTDIGAYEKKPSDDALLCELTVICDAVAAAPYDVTLGAIVSGSRKAGLSYTWSAIRTYLGVVTTNTVVTADPAYVFTDLEKGDWAFALTVTNDHEPPDVSTDETDGNVIHLSPEICYVSPTGSHVWPYDTPATASTNFIDVVAEARGRIVVLPGAYENLPHVTDANGKDFVGIFEHAVTIEGPDDPRAATINCDGLGGFKLANAGVKLSGVAFTNFAAKAKMDGDSSALTVAAGLASNVVVDACNRPNRQKGNYVNIGPGAMLIDSLVTGAKSDSWGGGNVLVNVGGTVRNCSISNNNNDHTALISMGYDSASQKSARLEGCVITNNTVANGIVGCSGVVEDCLVEGNKSKSGGAILSLAKASKVRRCRILRNTTSASCIVGPGWCVDQNVWSPAVLENCLVAENSANYAVAQSDNTRGAMTLVNLTVANNTCTRGGVFYGNNVKDDGTAIQYPNRHCMTNCILCANVVGSAVTNFVGRTLDGYLFVGHNCYSEAVEDDGNFNTAQDPQLRAFGRKIYQPKSSSPCVATGDAWFWTEDDVDVAGNPRLRKGAVDMGCYEPFFPGLMLLLK